MKDRAMGNWICSGAAIGAIVFCYCLLFSGRCRHRYWTFSGRCMNCGIGRREIVVARTRGKALGFLPQTYVYTHDPDAPQPYDGISQYVVHRVRELPSGPYMFEEYEDIAEDAPQEAKDKFDGMMSKRYGYFQWNLMKMERTSES